MAHVVVFVPGIMGSVLKLNDEVIWPRPIQSLVFPYQKMPQLLDPNLVATDCIRHFILPQYQSIINDLEICGFEEQTRTLIICAYDWRKSIEQAANTLAKALADVSAPHRPA